MRGRPNNRGAAVRAEARGERNAGGGGGGAPVTARSSMSNRGEASAASAAWMARSAPEARPMVTTPIPASAITDRTSAKSTLII